MRKILLSLSALLAFGVATAQNDLSIVLNSPSASSTVGPGLPLSFNVTITNLGTVDVLPADTIIFAPQYNGGYLTGPNGVIAYFITGVTITTNDMETRAVNFGGFSIQGATAGNVDFCATIVRVSGANWSGVVESNIVNNTSCNSVAYDPGSTVGLAENLIYAEAKSLLVSDASYASGSTYFVEAYNLASASATVTFVDLTGRTLLTQEFAVNNSELKGQMSLASLPQGIVLAVLSVDGQAVSTKKVMLAH